MHKKKTTNFQLEDREISEAFTPMLKSIKRTQTPKQMSVLFNIIDFTFEFIVLRNIE